MMKALPELARLTARTLLSGKRGWAAALLLLLPCVVALALALLKPGGADAELLYRNIAFYYSLRFMIFLLALIFGISLTSGEIEEGTAGYLFLGAIPKWLVVFVQALTALATLGTLCAASLLLTALGAGLPWEDLGRAVGGAAVVAVAGLSVALGFCLFCGLAFRRPLAVAVIATFLWELMMSVMPVRFAAYTVTNNLRALVLHLVFEGDHGRWFRYVRNFTLPSYDEAALFLPIAAAVSLAAAMLAASRRSIEGRESR